MENYPDDVTHKLVKTISEVIGLSGTQVMQAFGEYWIEYTAKVGYESIMDMYGDTLPEFLKNLDHLHTRMGVNFPQYTPPYFESHEHEEQSLELHYYSRRQGLTPMVIGLLKGLGTKFNTEVNITHMEDKQHGSDHHVFLIQYEEH